MATAQLHLLLMAIHTHRRPSRMDSTRGHPLPATWATIIQQLQVHSFIVYKIKVDSTELHFSDFRSQIQFPLITLNQV